MSKNTTQKKYSVTYASGCTGFGWEDDYDRIDEFEHFVDEYRKESTVYLTVYDHHLGDFIFFKRALHTPEVDMLHGFNRDLRTRTRKAKPCV